MSVPRRSLRRAAAIRVGLALLAVAAVAVLVAIVVYQTILERASIARSENVIRDYQEKIHNIERGWDEFLMREKLRLEFMRLLEIPVGRWDRLRAYLNTLTDTQQFAGLTICDSGGNALFRQGPEAGCVFASAQKNAPKAYHYFTDAAGGLFLAMDAPLWLGPEGMGRMRLIVPLDHSFLWRSTFVGTDLFIEWRGRLVASSAGESGLSAAVHPREGQRFERGGAYYVQRRIALPGKDTPPQLLIQTHIELPLSIAESAALGLGIFLLLGMMIVLALQGWLAQLLPRIESLGQAAQLYGKDEKLSAEIDEKLKMAAGRNADELTDAAQAARNMVSALAERENARLAEEARRRRDEEKLLLSERVFENSAQAILITDADSRIISVNPAFTGITGYSAQEVIGENPHKFASGRHDTAFYAAMWDSLKRNGAWSGEVWDRRKNGEVYPNWMTISAVRDAGSGAATHYVAIFSDISEQKENAARIEHLAYHDALTGLPNRFALNARLEMSLADARRNNSELAVMFIDLDRFKTINDSLGHNIGDQLLITVAQRIRALLRESDTVARLGGDEFVIVFPAVNGPKDAAHVAEKIIKEVGEPMLLAGHTLHVTPSIGIGVFPSDGSTADTLLKNADAAMYHAKQQGRNNFHFFTAEMDVAAGARLLLETQLHYALERREFFLAFQPQVEIATGRVVGAEALVRWRHPERGELQPGQFIAIAEEIGLIVPLGDWVLEEACRQAVAWGDPASGVRIAVNLSVRQIKSRHLVEHVAATLARTGLPPHRLELEITESAVIENPEAAIEILLSLAALGVRIAVDDFGTGYSSLAYLKRLPCSRLKIDRSFIMELDTDANDAAITKGIIALAHSLGLAVTAEGIETPAQIDMLKRFGCGEGQGFFFSRPLSADALRGFIAQRPC